jgi:nucleoside-diphosphate-sugar epimerase
LGRKAFLTGGSGFVGINVAQALLAAGWEVTALHRATSDTTYLRRFQIELAPGSTTEMASLINAMPEGTEVVFHVAGSTNLWRARNEDQTRDNVDGTRNVVEACLDRKVRRLIVTSSVASWGPIDGLIDERTPQKGGSSWINYQKTKYEAEQVAKKGMSRGLEVVIMNPCSIMGPYDVGTWSRMFTLIKNGKLPGVPPGTRSFAHVWEVALAHVSAAEHGRSGEHYLLGGTNASMLEMVQIMCKLMGKKEPKSALSEKLMPIVGVLGQFFAELRHRVPDMTPEAAALTSTRYTCLAEKAQKELGFKVVGLDNMVKDSYDWLVAEGRL